MKVVYADGPGAPRVAPEAAVAAAGLDGAFEVMLGWTPERLPWIDDPAFRATTTLAGYGISHAVNEGRIAAPPTRLGAVASMIERDPPDLAVVSVVRRGDGFAFLRGVGWADVLCRVAGRVVVEVAEGAVDIGTPTVEGNVVAEVVRGGGVPPVSLRGPDEIDRAIAAHVVSLLPDDATLQFGIGAVPDTIAAMVDRPVHVWSGLVTEAMAGIHARGLLASPAVAAYTWGGEPIDRLHADGMLRFESTAVTHDIGRLAAIPRLASINAGLQVGYDGSVNVERVGGRTIAGIGGHSDFSAGASRSVGGLSVVALRSTGPDGSPTIVPQVEVVSTQRSDVDVVVTEHGIADLRGCVDAERATRLRTIAG
jgi:acyl-CoA hydrolase